MAKIPNFSNQELSVPGGVRSVGQVRQLRAVGLDRGQGIVANALLQAGIDLDRINKDREEREDKIAAVEAETKYLRGAMELDRQITSDNDYGTYGSRYEEGMAKLTEDVIGGIKDPTRRRFLEAKLSTSTVRGAAAMQGKSFAKERDVGIARLDENLSAGLNSLALAQSDEARASILSTAESAIQTAAENQYITLKQATDQRQAFTAGYAETRLAQLAPADQLKALAEPKGFVKFIDPKRREAFKTAAENKSKTEEVRIQSQDAFDTIMGMNLTYEQQQAYVRKNLTGEARDETMRRIDAQFQRDKRAEAEEDTTMDKGVIEYLEKGGRVADHPQISTWKPGRLASYRSIEAVFQGRAKEKRTEENITWAGKMQEFALGGGELSDRTNHAEIAARAPAGRIRTELLKTLDEQLSGETSAPEATDSMINSVIGSAFPGNGNTAKRALLREQFNIRREVKQQETGKKLTVQEATEIKDQLMKEVTYDKGWMSLEVNKRVFQLTDEDRAAMATIEVPVDTAQAIRDKAKKENPRSPPLKDAQIRFLFFRNYLEE